MNEGEAFDFYFKKGPFSFLKRKWQKEAWSTCSEWFVEELKNTRLAASLYKQANVRLKQQIMELTYLNMQTGSKLRDAEVALRSEVDKLTRDKDLLKLPAKMWLALLAEHDRVDPVCAIVWKRDDNRESSDWVNMIDQDDVVKHLAKLVIENDKVPSKEQAK